MDITEDYVSLETAKLLKEKGFPQTRMLEDFITGMVYKVGTHAMFPQLENRRYNKDRYIAAPTLQMACKWLRKEKNLCIYVFSHKDGYEYGKWEAGICYCDDAIDATINACGHIFGETYEEAVEAALKYTLENLI